jgi:hypothetical protein
LPDAKKCGDEFLGEGFHYLAQRTQRVRRQSIISHRAHRGRGGVCIISRRGRRGRGGIRDFQLPTLLHISDFMLPTSYLAQRTQRARR